MKRWRIAIAAAALAVAMGICGYRLGRARADGIPSTQPLTYSGLLEEAGNPVTGDRFIFVGLWKDASSTNAADRACQTTSTTKTAVAAGWFTVDLDAACTAAVNANPDLWVELIVEGQPLPRTKLKAVPYALQAGQAMRAPWAGITGVPADVTARRTVTASVNDSGTVVRQDGAWVASASFGDIGNGQGTWTVTFAAGAFSAAPTCVCNGGLFVVGGTGTYYACSVESVSQTAATVATLRVSSFSSAPYTAYLVPNRFGFDVQCTGPR